MVLWSREALLSNSTLLLDCQEVSTTSEKDGATLSIIRQLVDNINGKLIISGSISLPLFHHSLITFDVPKLITSDVFVTIWLEFHGLLHNIGGRNKLASLLNSCVSSVNVDALAELIRESGGFEQEAAVMLGLYREDYYDKQTTQKGIFEVSVLKSRFSSETTVNKIV
ncbi:hypothetical protein [Nostoc sp.]|uniref:hypothetical protein n=1 Tax=Nostoc sp. TaxID=1180 RepID=UPI002FFD1227